MTDKVTLLKVVERPPPGKPQPQPKVIAYIEKLLLRAKSGEIQGFAAAWADAEGAPCSGWNRGDTDRAVSYLLVTAVTCLQADVVAELNEGAINLPEPEPPPEETS